MENRRNDKEEEELKGQEDGRGDRKTEKMAGKEDRSGTTTKSD